jgi:GT2 family glycosyltransferase
MSTSAVRVPPTGGVPALGEVDVEHRQYGPRAAAARATLPGPTVSIAILTFSRAARLGELLASLSDVVSQGVELIVVDNNSQDATREVVAGAGMPVTYVRTGANIGVAARNLGLRRASGDVVVCLDDDVFGIDQRAIEIIRTAFANDPRLGAINFKVLDPWTNEISNWVHHCEVERFADSIFPTYEITEGAVAFRTAALAAAGWYADCFFLSHEGPDLAIRLIDRGYDVVYRGDIAVKHWHASEGRLPWRRYYYDTRNQYWLAARNFPLGYALRYLARGQISTCLYALRDGYVGHWLRAVRDGLGGLRAILRERRTVSVKTMSTIRAIDANRPSWVYMSRKRLFRKAIRL